MKINYIIFILLISYVILEDKCDKGAGPYQCKECDPKNPTLCGSCNEQEYLKDGKCYNCFERMIGCSKCNVTHCQECSDEGYLMVGDTCMPMYKIIPECQELNPEDHSKCKRCIIGFYPNEDKTKCLKCKEECLWCNNASECTKCNTSFYKENGKCLPCNDNCLSCDSTKCFECKPGYVPVNEKCASCEVANCKECVKGEPKKCQTCNDTFSIIGEDKSICRKCEQYCKSCSEIKEINFLNENQKCDSCISQYFLNNSKCQKCEDNNCAICDPDGKQCKQCVEGYYQENETSLCNKRC